MHEDFISQYLSYIGDTECPMFYHRWCCISMIGAYLGRQYNFKFGHFNFNPNLYVMLIGTPGARKSTAIKISKKILKLAGYNTFSAEKSTKEKFLLDLAGEGNESSTEVESILEKNIWGDDTAISDPCEMYIACDEFNDFIGSGNIEFISLLGSLWDYEGTYSNRIKNGKSIFIPDPTISILGGNTPSSFARAFPPEVIEQGFFSRLLLIHGNTTGKRITFPIDPDINDTNHIVSELQRIKSSIVGVSKTTKTAEKLIDKIYQTWKPLDDIRFEHYSQRRFSHLLKLCLVLSASSYRKEITEIDVVRANTILTHTEKLMPKALGQFGKGRNSDVSHKIMQIIDTASDAMNIKELWTYLHQDLEKISDLGEMIRSLSLAGKIQIINGNLLPNKRIVEEVNSDVIDYSYLTNEEREMPA